MTTLEWVTVAAVAIIALGGLRTGVSWLAFSLAGLFAGSHAGVWLASRLASQGLA